MYIKFGREICSNLDSAESREWLVTNGIGGYASGTVSGLLTRRYHGLLMAALNPPVGRTLLLTKLDETAFYASGNYPFYTNRWKDGIISPHGYRNIEKFTLEGTVPVWHFACADALLVKRIWMQQGANTSYIQYTLYRATQPLVLNIKALVNYRDYHGNTQSNGWEMQVEPVENGVCVKPYPGAIPFYLLSDNAIASPADHWYYGFDLAVERYRGLSDCEDHFHAANFTITLNPGESVTLIASTEEKPILQGENALELRRCHERNLINIWQSKHSVNHENNPNWLKQLVLAADQFIVDRSLPKIGEGKTIIAGYHWFADWGRDTMISLPGLTIATGRTDIAGSILRIFSHYVDRGMLPNCFPDAGEKPEYNTVDATLWYFEAIRAYDQATQDKVLLRELFPVLVDIINWHCRGTRYNIHQDPTDGLLYAGEVGVQLTWMDARVGNWVVTPRIGKPIEINALWYNALRNLAKFAQDLGESHQKYEIMADKVLANFWRFWNTKTGYCYDVIDGINGNDISLRPNQLFAVSLPESPLTFPQQKQVVEICGRMLLTSYGLRSLAPDNPHYQGEYGGEQPQRDAVYHQGTVWGWLLGTFVQAHLKVYKNPAIARSFIEPMAEHLSAAGIGNLSEIFDGDTPLTPRGCIAQAWTVAEVLRTWLAINS